MSQHLLADLADTDALGRRLGQALQSGDFVGLSGDLGAGKTTLVRSIAAGAGVSSDDVSSPTFALIHTYAGTRLPVHHADLYRLSSRDELFATGYFDLLDAEGALLVEWIDRIPAAAPRDWLHLRLSMGEGDQRTIDALAHGPRGEALRTALSLP